MKKAFIIMIAVITACLLSYFLLTNKTILVTSPGTPAGDRPLRPMIQADAQAPEIKSGQFRVRQAPPQKVKAGEVFFDYIEGDEQAVKQVTDSIHAALQSMCGMKNILLVNNTIPGSRPGFIMDGSVLKSGEKYRISLKVRDCRTSKIVCSFYENAPSQTDIDAACGRLLKKIRLALL